MIVSKATSVYAIMVVVLAGGMWFILSMGSMLVPPTDLAGKWELDSPAGTHELSVEQSGKFVDLEMAGWTASLKIQHDGNQNPTQRGIIMAGRDQTVTFDGLGSDDRCTIRFEGPIKGIYQAHRTFRAFR